MCELWVGNISPSRLLFPLLTSPNDSTVIVIGTATRIMAVVVQIAEQTKQSWPGWHRHRPGGEAGMFFHGKITGCVSSRNNLTDNRHGIE